MKAGASAKTTSSFFRSRCRRTWLRDIILCASK